MERCQKRKIAGIRWWLARIVAIAGRAKTHMLAFNAAVPKMAQEVRKGHTSRDVGDVSTSPQAIAGQSVA